MVEINGCDLVGEIRRVWGGCRWIFVKKSVIA